MRKLYSNGGEGWVLASQLHKAINDALVAAGGEPVAVGDGTSNLHHRGAQL